MNTYFLFLSIILLFSHFSFSQDNIPCKKNSFYVGKRGAIEMGLNPRVSFFYQEDVNEKSPKYNLGYWGEYTYALTNSFSTTINIGRNTYYRELIDFRGGRNSTYGHIVGVEESGQFLKEMKTTRVGIRLNKSLSRRKGALAPMGHYIGAGVQLFMTSLDYMDKPLNLVMFYNPNFNTYKDIIVQQAEIMDPLRFNIWTFDLIYGYRKNISKNVFISWAFSTSLTSYYYKLKDIHGEEYYSYFNYYDTDPKTDFNDVKTSDLVNPSRYIMRTSNFFNFNFGIGIILH